jgi:hypothetical protein
MFSGLRDFGNLIVQTVSNVLLCIADHLHDESQHRCSEETIVEKYVVLSILFFCNFGNLSYHALNVCKCLWVCLSSATAAIATTIIRATVGKGYGGFRDGISDLLGSGGDGKEVCE